MNDESILAGELMKFLESIKDHGTSIDSGSGMSAADMWVTSDGVEWFITVRKSNNQIAREAL